jgi:hypothetical protein
MASQRDVNIRLAVQNAEQAIANLREFGAQGEAALRQIERATKPTSEALESAGRSAGKARAQFSNFGNQIQDIAVQLQGGTDAVRVLSQQLPQLLGGFGALGVGIGATVSVAGLLATKFLGLGEQIDHAKEQTAFFNDVLGQGHDALDKTIAKLRDASDATKAFAGEQASQVAKQELQNAQAPLNALFSQSLANQPAEPIIGFEVPTSVPLITGASGGRDRLEQAVKDGNPEAVQRIASELGLLAGNSSDIQALITAAAHIGDQKVVRAAASGLSGGFTDTQLKIEDPNFDASVQSVNEQERQFRADRLAADQRAKSIEMADAARSRAAASKAATQADNINDTIAALTRENAAVQAEIDVYTKAGVVLDAKAKAEEALKEQVAAVEGATAGKNKVDQLDLKTTGDQAKAIVEMSRALAVAKEQRAALQAQEGRSATDAERVSDELDKLQREGEATQQQIDLFTQAGVTLNAYQQQQLELALKEADLTAAVKAQNEAIQQHIDLQSEDGQKLQDRIRQDAEREVQLKALKDAQQEQVRQQQQIFLEPLKEAGRQIQDTISDSIYKAFTGQITTVKDFFNEVLDIGLHTLAQLATVSIFNPGSLVSAAQGGGAGAPGFGLGSLFGSSTLGSAFPRVFGAGSPVTSGGITVGSTGGGLFPGLAGVGLGGLVGAGSLGFLGGGLLANFTGGNPLTGGLGGGLGAGLGFALGGPFGALAGGAAGSLLGGLFGGQHDHPNNNFGGIFDPTTGTFTAGRNTNPDPGLQQQVSGIGQMLGTLVEGLRQMGITVGRTTLSLRAGLRDGFELNGHDYGSAEGLGVAAMRQVVLGSSGVGYLSNPASIRSIATRSTAANAQDFLRDIGTPAQMEALIHPASQFKQALDQLKQAFDAANDNAVRLHLSTTALNAAEKERIAQLKEQAQAELGQLQQNLQGVVGNAFGFLDPIRQARSGLDLATGRPADQYAAALKQFQAVQAGIGRGDVGSFQLLPGVSQNLLSAAQANFGGGAQAASVVEQVRQTFDKAIKQGEDAQKPVIDALHLQVNKTQTLVDVANLALANGRQIAEQIAGLRRDLARAA